MMKWLLILTTAFVFSACTKKGSSIEDGFLAGVSVSAGASTITVSASSIMAGNSTTVTLTTRDSEGNIYHVPGSNPVITFKTSGGTSTGIFSPVTNNGDGTYTTLFSGSTAGTATAIMASVDSVELTTQSALVTVLPANFSVTNSYVTLSASTVASGSNITATFHSYDVNNSPITHGGLNVSFVIQSGTSTGTFSTVTDNNDGTYSATFTGKLVGTAASIKATVAGISITSAMPTVTVTPGAAATIAVSSGNSQSGVVNTALSTTLKVLITDAEGNAVPSVQVDWTTTGNSSLGSATSNTNSSGLASDTLTLGTVTGSYTVTAKIHGTTTTTTFTATATPGGINNFLLSGVPSSATAGSSFTTTVTARDSYNNIKTDYTGTVQFSSSDSNTPSLPANYTFTSGDVGTKQFTFTLKGSGNQTITATQVSGGSPTVTSANIAVSASATTQLVIISGPSHSVAGVSFSTLTIRALDAYSNTATAFTGNVTLGIGTNPGSGSLSGTTTVAAVAGTASFTGLSINKTGTGYTLVASSSGLTSATTSTFNITPAAAASIAVNSGDAQSAQVNAALAASLVAVVKDAYSNVISGVTVDWSTDNGSLGGSSSSTNSSGLASNSLTLATVATTHTVTATVHGTALSTTFTATANPGPINNFLLSGVPASATAGSSFTTTITARDSYNNVKTDYVGTVQFSSTDSNSPTLPGNYTFLPADAGSKQFSFTFKTSGNQTLTATQVAGGSPTVTSSSISVSAGTATQLAMISGPTNTVAGSSISTLLVRALDAYANTATSFNGAITISIGTNPGSATLNGTVTGSASSGSVSFAGLNINTAATGYTLIAASSGLTSATSGTFNITAAAPASIAIHSGNNQSATVATALPANMVAVVKDTYNNVVPSTTVNWSTDAGTLGAASSSTNSSGLASNSLTLATTTGSHNVTATVASTALSTSFVATSTNAIASQLVYSTQPVGGVTPGTVLPTQPVVQIQDSYGNLVTTGADATADVTLSLTSGSGSLGGTVTVAASGGIATFSSVTVSAYGSGKVITATKSSTVSSGGTSSVTRQSNSFTIIPPPPAAFTISSAVAGSSQVILSWGNSTDATSYTVKYGTSSGSYTTTVSTNATSPLTISSLNPGTTYYFQVDAINSTATTSATAEASATPLSTFSISSVTVNAGNKLRVQWGNSTGATSYTVKFGTSSGSYSTTDSTSATSPYDIASLTGGTTYYVMITATNSSGSVNATAEATGIPISAFSLSSITPSVGSSAIAFASAAGTTTYDLLYDTSSHTAAQSYASSKTNVTSPASNTGLSAGTTYYYRVRANNSYGSVVSTNELSGAVYQTFSLSIPFTAGTEASYTMSSSSSFELTGGVARLAPASLTDNTSTQFSAGTNAGTQWDSTLSALRLNSTENKTTFDSSWTPKWSNLIAYWKMDNNLNDSVGSYNMTVTGTPTYTAPGKVGTYYGTFSSGNYGSIASGPPLANSSFSISAWVYVTNTSGTNKHILGYGTTTTDAGLHFGYTSTGTIRLGFYSDDLTTTTNYNTLDVNRWVHLAATYDSTTKTREIYRDGVAVATGTAAADFSGSGTFYIGQGLATNAFAGNIDELALWSAPLTATQVSAIFNNQSAKYSGRFSSRIIDAGGTGSTNYNWSNLALKTTLPFYKEVPLSSEASGNYSSIIGNMNTGLIAFWRFNESSWNGTAGEVLDITGNNHGTRSGTATTFAGGRFGNAGQFVSTSDSVVTSAGSTFIPTTDHAMTISAWIYPYAIGTTGATAIDNRIISIHKGAVAGSTLAFGLGNTNKLMFFTSSTSVFTSSTLNISTSAWTHVALTYDGTCFQMYINGISGGPCYTASLVAGGSFGTRIGSYASVNSPFNGLLDEMGIWGRAMTQAEVQQLYRRGVNRVKYQVRTCTTNDCSDQAAATNLGWKGPDNSASTYFSELYNTTNNVLGGTLASGAPTMTFTNFGSLSLGTTNRYFQYRAFLESDDTNSLCTYASASANCSPELQYAATGPTRYDSSSPSITATGASVTSAFEVLDSAAFTEVLGANSCSSGVKYSLSADGTNFYYWNPSSSAWEASSSASTASDATTIAAHINTFSGVATGTLRVKAYLQSSGSSQCELDSLTITGKKY